MLQHIDFIERIFWNCISLASKFVISFGSVFFAAQVLGPEQFYIIGTGFVILLATQTLADWGYNLTSYKLACAKKFKDIRPLVLEKFKWTALLILLVTPALLLLPNIGLHMLVFAFAGILQSNLNLFGLLTRAKDLYHIDAIVYLFQAFMFGICLLFLGDAITPLLIAVSLFAAKLHALLLEILLYNARIENLFSICDLRRIITIPMSNFMQVSPIGIFSILAIINLYADNFILGLITSTNNLGIYQAHMRLVLAVITLFEVIGVILQNELLKKFSQEVVFRRYSSVSIVLLSVIVLLLSFVLSKFYVNIVIFTLGPEFTILHEYFVFFVVVVYMRIVGSVIALPVTFIAGKARIFALLISILVGICSNIALIPLYGIVGCLISSVLAHIFLNISYVYLSGVYIHRFLMYILLISVISIFLLLYA